MDQWQAARVIKNTWKRYRVRKDIQEISARIEETREQVESLHLHQRELSLVHPSNLETWKNNKSKPVNEFKLAKHQSENSKQRSLEVERVNLDQMDNVRKRTIQLIESRIRQDHRPDLPKLEILLSNYRRLKPFVSNSSLPEMLEILDKWDELHPQNFAANDTQYKKEMAMLQSKWWEIEEDDKLFDKTKLIDA